MEITPEQGGFILLNKPYTWTSFQATKKIQYILKRHFGLKKIKIGHAGTLDPLATGLLVLCVGKYTKRIEEFQAQEKEYTGTIHLGATTPSYDLETEIDNTYPVEHINENLIYETAKSFIGEQSQIPPIFSALKINGVRAYTKAREGKEVEIKERTIYIYDFEITDIRFPEVDFRIRCSKGTYIRSIARDFGAKLNSGAYLSALCRTKIGDFKLSEAFSIEQVEEQFPPKSTAEPRQ
ncbi:MAG: tRNA pseudouridine(55) synthase TruB [Bacteroidales bacterium]|nr:tRNA pseudouridine(55) synthase TruB [Bacteroidales bacterium]